MTFFPGNEPPSVDGAGAFGEHDRLNPLALELKAHIFPLDGGALDIDGRETCQNVQQEKASCQRMPFVVHRLSDGQELMHNWLQPLDDVDETIRHDLGAVVRRLREVCYEPIRARRDDDPLRNGD